VRTYDRLVGVCEGLRERGGDAREWKYATVELRVEKDGWWDLVGADAKFLGQRVMLLLPRDERFVVYDCSIVRWRRRGSIARRCQ
jgi:hypothetical protein